VTEGLKGGIMRFELEKEREIEREASPHQPGGAYSRGASAKLFGPKGVKVGDKVIKG
jgi:hypothetical protein